MISQGDVIYCVNKLHGVTLDKGYTVTMIRPDILKKGGGIINDICIHDDMGHAFWFGQEGEFEPWTNWFVTELVWKRNQKINQII